MSRVERNRIREEEKKHRTRLVRVRDFVVIFACLIGMFAYISSLSKITPEPEYVFAGGTTKDVPVYLIGLPLEEDAEEAENAE